MTPRSTPAEREIAERTRAEREKLADAQMAANRKLADEANRTNPPSRQVLRHRARRGH